MSDLIDRDLLLGKCRRKGTTVKMPTPQNREELERMIVEYPLHSFFHMRTGLLDKINDNGEDMLFLIQDIAEDLVMLGCCVLLAMWHMVSAVFYPVSKVYRFVQMRNRILANLGRLQVKITRDQDED